MKSICAQVHQKVLESSDAALSRQEQEHLDVCADCREAAENAAAVGSELTLIAARVGADIPAQLPQDLRDRVAGRLEERLTQAKSQPNSSRRPNRTAPRFGQWLSEILGSRRAAGFAIAAVVAVVCIGIGTQQVLERQPIGRLDFATGPISVSRSASTERPAIAGKTKYRKSSTLQLSEGAMGIFSLGSHVRGALAASTKVEMLDEDRIRLVEGAVWVRVLPKGRGFLLHSPHGTVRVTGTSFGVAATSEATLVEVAKGTVEVSCGAEKVSLPAGQMIRLAGSALGAPEPRPVGIGFPGWVESVLAKEKAAHTGKYIPSLGIE